MDSNTVRKTVTISEQTNDKLLEYFGNNHTAGQFLTFLIERAVSKLEEWSYVKNSDKLNVNINDKNLIKKYDIY